MSILTPTPPTKRHHLHQCAYKQSIWSASVSLRRQWHYPLVKDFLELLCSWQKLWWAPQCHCAWPHFQLLALTWTRLVITSKMSLLILMEIHRYFWTATGLFTPCCRKLIWCCIRTTRLISRLKLTHITLKFITERRRWWRLHRNVFIEEMNRYTEWIVYSPLWFILVKYRMARFWDHNTVIQKLSQRAN